MWCGPARYDPNKTGKSGYNDRPTGHISVDVELLLMAFLHSVLSQGRRKCRGEGVPRERFRR